MKLVDTVESNWRGVLDLFVDEIKDNYMEVNLILFRLGCE